MAEADVETITGQSAELLLDPFAFHPGVASRIVGLGHGEMPGQDPAYVFHTPYVEAAAGHAHFIIRFRNLKAKRGTLVLRVHMVAHEAGAQARLVNSQRIQLNRLVGLGGETAIRFEGYRGVSFALYGGIADTTDAQADGLEVTLDRPASEDDDALDLVDARNTDFGQTNDQAEAQLVSMATATLADPVSQPATEAQLREPAFFDWQMLLRPGAQSRRVQWSHAFVLQTLRRYGLLKPGAVALSLGAGAGAIANVVRDAGVRVQTARRPDLPTVMPRDLVNHDVLWTIGAAARYGSTEAGARFIEAAQSCLRPGGFAIHVLPFDPAASQDRMPSDGRAVFGRGDIERIALALISRGHQVAQIKLDASEPVTGEDGDAVARFGLIVRRALMAGSH